MKEENKKEVKKNVITGVSTASGAAVGTIVEDVVKPFVAFADDSKEPPIISKEEAAQIGNPEGKEESSLHEDIQQSVVSFAAPDVTVHEEPVIASTESAVEEAIVGIEEPVVDEPSISPLEAQVVAEVPAENEAASENEVQVENEETVEMEPAIVGVETTVEEIDGIEVVSIENTEEDLEIAVENMDPEFIEMTEEIPDYLANEDSVDFSEDPLDENLIEGDFTDTRIEGFGHMASAANEMPDYVNNANIDSFMDLG